MYGLNHNHMDDGSQNNIGGDGNKVNDLRDIIKTLEYEVIILRMQRMGKIGKARK